MDPSTTPAAQYYEGCGHEGPIRCIFLCEFHPKLGPKIKCQVPDDYISKEIFDAVSVYIIPKPQLQRCILTVNVLGYKIVGFPLRIDSQKYARNALYFNLCFVCDSWAKSVQYEPVVKKLAEYFASMEEESGFLSDGDTTRYFGLLDRVLNDLNTYRQCTVVEGETTIYLKIVQAATDPPIVKDHVVPVFVEEYLAKPEDWDLTTQQVIPFIDGFNHIARIAYQSDVETNLVKACIQNLVYYGVVKLLPILKYSNVYMVSAGFRALWSQDKLQKQCRDYISLRPAGPQPSLNKILEFYSAMGNGTTLKSLCVRFRPHKFNIDERRLVVFGLQHNLIKCIHKYPIYTGGDPPVNMQRLFTGQLSIDELCCSIGMSLPQIEDIIESDPDVLMLYK
uniref:Putative nitrogen permease regulator 2-like protein n=1 Tax=Xenopsylla cheopis TaxID=163159 RepID=A0A6M2DGE4_XENCH